jgi:hypothetical protein
MRISELTVARDTGWLATPRWMLVEEGVVEEDVVEQGVVLQI